MTTSSRSRKTRTHTFTVSAPQAKEVFVAGSFNDWRRQPMKRDRTGQWSASIELKPGRHEFKFIVDGQWCCRPGCNDEAHECPDCVPNDFGTMNRVLDID